MATVDDERHPWELTPEEAEAMRRRVRADEADVYALAAQQLSEAEFRELSESLFAGMERLQRYPKFAAAIESLDRPNKTGMLLKSVKRYYDVKSMGGMRRQSDIAPVDTATDLATAYFRGGIDCVTWPNTPEEQMATDVLAAMIYSQPAFSSTTDGVKAPNLPQGTDFLRSALGENTDLPRRQLLRSVISTFINNPQVLDGQMVPQH